MQHVSPLLQSELLLKCSPVRGAQPLLVPPSAVAMGSLGSAPQVGRMEPVRGQSEFTPGPSRPLRHERQEELPWWVVVSAAGNTRRANGMRTPP